jgi:hypothetical protein
MKGTLVPKSLGTFPLRKCKTLLAEIFLEAVGGAGRPPRKVFIFNLFGNAAAGS